MRSAWLVLLAACQGSLGHSTGDAGVAAAPDARRDAPMAPPLECDRHVHVAPDAPGTGELVSVTYDDSDPLVYLELDAQGPGEVEVGTVTVLPNAPPWRWRWPLAIHGAGVYEVAIRAGQPSIQLAHCTFDVAGTGAPPPIPLPPPAVCGEGDSTLCPMAASAGGACMDPPSPIGPDGPAQWSCLDAAGCDGSTCRIWCPGEPCDLARHPDGCPQGVEACWVDPHITDYEEACRQCCESRLHTTGEYACWDDAINLCRHPGDCGLPYPLP